MSMLLMRARKVLREAGFSIQECEVLMAEDKSLLDKFAAEAMGAQIQFEGMEGCDKEHIAGMAYEVADAMMEMRRKGK